MKPPESHANLLLVGDDLELMQIMMEALHKCFPNANIKRCGTLRLGSPDAPMHDASAVMRNTAIKIPCSMRFIEGKRRQKSRGV